MVRRVNGRAVRGLMREFQEFALKGNVVDLAVAVIIGGAFGKIVSSLVENIIMPLVSLVIPGGEWRSAKIVLGMKTAADGKAVENAILLGNFIGTIVDFAIVAFVIFLLIRAIVKFKRQEETAVAEEAPPLPDPQERTIDALERLIQAVEKLK